MHIEIEVCKTFFHNLSLGVSRVFQSLVKMGGSPVDVDNGNQVVQFVVGGEGSCLPHTALSSLSVSHHAVHSVAEGGGGGGGGE